MTPPLKCFPELPVFQTTGRRRAGRSAPARGGQVLRVTGPPGCRDEVVRLVQLVQGDRPNPARVTTALPDARYSSPRAFIPVTVCVLCEASPASPPRSIRHRAPVKHCVWCVSKGGLTLERTRRAAVDLDRHHASILQTNSSARAQGITLPRSRSGKSRRRPCDNASASSCGRCWYATPRPRSSARQRHPFAKDLPQGGLLRPGRQGRACLPVGL